MTAVQKPTTVAFKVNDRFRPSFSHRIQNNSDELSALAFLIPASLGHLLHASLHTLFYFYFYVRVQSEKPKTR